MSDPKDWKHQRVLDHGYVRFIDSMGSDETVIEAARMSTGKGFLGWEPALCCVHCGRRDNDGAPVPFECTGRQHRFAQTKGDANLLEFLYRNQHMTPFEMCLAGETRIPTFACVGAKQKTYTIERLARAFQRGGQSDSWAKLVFIRTVDPVTGRVSRTKILNAWRSGEAQCYRVTEALSGRSIRVTNTHPFLCPDGVFRTIRSGSHSGDTGLHAGDAISLNGIRGLRKAVGAHADPRAIARRVLLKGPCQIVGCQREGRDIHHRDENPHNNDLSNLVRVCPKHHRVLHNGTAPEFAFAATIASIVPDGVCDVFDLEVASSNHTFVAEGFVVHNCELHVEVKAPIFVFREWHRHRTFSFNEFSARYAQMPNEHYVPELERFRPKVSSNKQESGVPAKDGGNVALWQEDVKNEQKVVYDNYDAMVSMGVPREVARINTPVARYSKMRAKTDLRNWLGFLKLRMDPAAQFEIRCYANAIAEIVKGLWPRTYALFEEHTLGAVTLSKSEVVEMKELLRGDRRLPREPGIELHNFVGERLSEGFLEKFK